MSAEALVPEPCFGPTSEQKRLKRSTALLDKFKILIEMFSEKRNN